MDNNNLIDRYFDGEMSEVEMKEFENSVKKDPVLEKEFLFQQEIIESIRTARMAELKANLNAIDVSGIASGTASTWLYKTVASAVVVGGAITYFTFFSESESAIEEVIEPIEQTTVSPLSNKSEVKSIEEVKELEVTKATEVKPKTSTPSIKPVETAKVDIRDTETASRNSPDVTDDFGDIDDAASNALPPMNELIDKSAFEHSTINVEINSDKQKYTFHYQLKNNTLYLYGTFDKVYEVLEFKHKNESDMYFFYDNKYYNIDETLSGINEFQELEGEILSELKQKIFSNEEAKTQ